MLLKLIAAILCLAAPLIAQDTETVTEPKLLSHFPIGGQQGTTFELEVSGKALQGAHTVWFEGGELSASILKLEKLQTTSAENDKEPDTYLAKAVKADHRAVFQVQVPKTASLGLHLFRLVTPRGLSNALALQVVSAPVVRETTRPAPHRGRSAIPVGPYRRQWQTLGEGPTRLLCVPGFSRGGTALFRPFRSGPQPYLPGPSRHYPLPALGQLVRSQPCSPVGR